MKISAIINTYNEEKNLKRCLESIKDFVDEIIVVDMHSTDKTVKIAEQFKAKVFEHEYTRYVEPARNFALSKTKGSWVLVIDADEELPDGLKKRLEKIVAANEFDCVEIPRKNIIFDSWISHSRWWPDYLVRFFKKGRVKYSNKIHLPPSVEGKKITLEASEENALVHYNFQSISQFIDRLNRYTDIQAEELLENNYIFNWAELVKRPINEFFSRFFAGEGYKDGVHGLVLALLQSFSELTVLLKVWEKQGFKKEETKNIVQIFEKSINDFLFWLLKLTPNSFKRFRLKIKAKI